MTRSTRSLEDALGQGWSIQIYSHDRRLLCSLYPSHAWAFILGTGAGFLVAWIGFANCIPSQQRSPAASNSVNAPLVLD